MTRFNHMFYSIQTAVLAGLAAMFLFGVLIGGSFAASSQLEQEREATWNAAIECLYKDGQLSAFRCDY